LSSYWGGERPFEGCDCCCESRRHRARSYHSGVRLKARPGGRRLCERDKGPVCLRILVTLSHRLPSSCTQCTNGMDSFSPQPASWTESERRGFEPATVPPCARGSWTFPVVVLGRFTVSPTNLNPKSVIVLHNRKVIVHQGSRFFFRTSCSQS
jgi:hypothetical protein